MNANPSRCPPRTLLMLAILGTTLPLALLGTKPAYAQSTGAVRDYALPAGPLSATLNTIARGAGLTLAIDPTMVSGRNAPPVQGRYTGEEAMRQALRDSGLQLIPGAGGQAYSLRPEPPRDSRDAVKLEPVHVSGRADPKEQIYDTLGSVAVVTREDLDRIPTTTPRDMFTTQAGVYVMDGNQDPGLNINIRGIAGPGRNNVMIDGTRQNASSYAGYNGQTSRVYVDPELIGGITIEKGPTSGAGGAGVIGGVVNMRTLDADDLIAQGQTRGGRLRAIYGNKGYNTSGMAAGAIKLDSGLELVAGISRRDSDNYYAGKHDAPKTGYTHCMDLTTPVPNCTNELPLTYQDMTSALMKAKYRFGDGHKIELGTTYYRNEYASWQRSIVLSDKYATPQLARNQTYTAKYSWTPADNPWWDLRANVWKVNGTTENSNYFERYKLDTWGMELFNTSRLRSQWVNVDLTYGGEYHADDATTEIMQGTGDVGLGLPGANPDRIGMTGSGKRNLRSAFATARFMHSSWLQVEAGLRHDSYGLQGRGSYASPYVGQANTDFTVDRSAGRVNPRLAIAITPVEGVQGYASYTEGFRPPSLAEAAAAGTVFGVPNVPNPLIKSEVAKNTEFGLNFARDNIGGATNKLRAKVARFQNNYDNFISRAQIPYQQSNQIAYTYFNLDKVTFRGTELQVSFDAGYAFIDMNFTQYDKMLFCNQGVCSEDIGTMANNGQPYIPPRRSLNGSVGVRLIDRKLVLGARVRKDNKRGTTDANAFGAGNAWVPYEIYDLFGSFAVNKQMTVGLSVENVTDKYYIGALSVSGVPSPGRNFKASLTYAF